MSDKKLLYGELRKWLLEKGSLKICGTQGPRRSEEASLGLGGAQSREVWWQEGGVWRVRTWAGCTMSHGSLLKALSLKPHPN